MLMRTLARRYEMAKAMNGQFPVKPDLDGLAAAANAAPKGQGAAPVHLWNPPFSGNLDIRIARNGTWYYQESAITRPAMVRLFSSILRKDGDKFFLVTPAERVGITVDDAPFVAVDVDIESSGAGQILTFETQVGDRICASAENPIRIEHSTDRAEPAPYILVRSNLEALIDRKTFYRMIEMAEHAPFNGEDWFGLHSCGHFFPIMRSDALR